MPPFDLLHSMTSKGNWAITLIFPATTKPLLPDQLPAMPFETMKSLKRGGSESSTRRPKRRRIERGVHFSADVKTGIAAPASPDLWYSENELDDFEQERRFTVKVLAATNGNTKLLGSSFCFRGLETYASVLLDPSLQSILDQHVQGVLAEQQRGSSPERIAEVSQCHSFDDACSARFFADEDRIEAMEEEVAQHVLPLNDASATFLKGMMRAEEFAQRIQPGLASTAASASFMKSLVRTEDFAPPAHPPVPLSNSTATAPALTVNSNANSPSANLSFTSAMSSNSSFAAALNSLVKASCGHCQMPYPFPYQPACSC